MLSLANFTFLGGNIVLHVIYMKWRYNFPFSTHFSFSVNYFYTIYSIAHYTSIYGLVILALNLYIRLEPPVNFEMLQVSHGPLYG